MIYEFVLAIPPDRYGTVRIAERPKHSDRYMVLSLLLTCRTIYQEAETVFYKVNRLMLECNTANSWENRAPFVLGHCVPVQEFLRALTHNRFDAIRDIALKGMTWATLTYALAEMQHLYGLQTILLLIDDENNWARPSWIEAFEYQIEAPELCAAVVKLHDNVREIQVRAVGKKGFSSAHPASPQMLFAAKVEQELKHVLAHKKELRELKDKNAEMRRLGHRSLFYGSQSLIS